MLYVFGLLSWFLILYGYTGVIGIDPFYQFFVYPILILLTIYHIVSFGLNLTYQQFDLDKHKKLIAHARVQTPSVDIFLPVCNENIEILENTWTYVSRINYPNFKVYVSDDSSEKCSEHKELAERFGFTYLERPNKGHMKKAGNLKHVFERSKGEFILILDADFAPHPDFINETIPYMNDVQIGIVQTPQYFGVTDSDYKSCPISYNAAYAEEPFYRFIQVTRNRYGGSICCGSNALYRRRALEAIGGPYQIDYSEDAHTGYAITSKGFRVLYIPIILAIGLCPDNYYAFFHQQHRWSMGSMRLMLSKLFWHAKISWKTKLCYMTGFIFYLHHPLIIIFPLQLFWTLFIYNDYIPFGTSLLFLPHLIFALVYLWIFPIAKIKPGYFVILLARTYAYSHAVFSAIFKKKVAWISTNAKHSSVSKAFRETTNIALFCFGLYIVFILIGFRTGDLHLFNYRYWSVQFWIFFNTLLAGLVSLRFVQTKRQVSRQGTK